MIISALKSLTWGTLAFAVGSAVLLAATGGGSLGIDVLTGDEPAARSGNASRSERGSETRRAGRAGAGNGGSKPLRDLGAN